MKDEYETIMLLTDPMAEIYKELMKEFQDDEEEDYDVYIYETCRYPTQTDPHKTIDTAISDPF